MWSLSFTAHLHLIKEKKQGEREYTTVMLLVGFFLHKAGRASVPGDHWALGSILVLWWDSDRVCCLELKRYPHHHLLSFSHSLPVWDCLNTKPPKLQEKASYFHCFGLLYTLCQHVHTRNGCLFESGLHPSFSDYGMEKLSVITYMFCQMTLKLCIVIWSTAQRQKCDKSSHRLIL